MTRLVPSRRVLRAAAGVAAAMLVVSLAAAVARPSEAQPSGGPGSAGTDTTIADTESAVTVKGRGAFSELEIKVNQTRNLVSQAVSLSWTGGTQTQRSDKFEENYLQVFQCWGDDDGTVAGNPGPPPDQCVGGATTGAFGLAQVTHSNGTFSVTRVIGQSSWPGYDPAVGVTDPRSGLVFRPFRAVDGTEVGVQFDVDFNPTFGAGNYWLNPYFDLNTTNEISGARTRPDGTGSDLFEINTGVESSGLGCGQRLLRPATSEFFTPKCWLVVVPRGSQEAENAGTPLGGGNLGVMTSPFSPAAWANRIAVPLEFNPIDTACELGGQDRRLVGTELVLPAVASWQPALCATPGLPSYSYANVSDAAARAQVVAPSPGSAGMVLVQRPAEPSTISPQSPAVYAPVALSGAVIGFNMDRFVDTQAGPEIQDYAGVRIQNLNFTPRLVAKLLTQSYTNQVQVNSGRLPFPEYEWAAGNPGNLRNDPDFVQFNPEFELLLTPQGRNFSGLLLPGANSDVAEQVWEWILADPEAKAWLDGNPDPWGMRVNPLYSTNAAVNPTGFPFADPVPVNFPKSEPFCYEVPEGTLAVANPPTLCGPDWMPYAGSLREAARNTRAADDRSRVALNSQAITVDQVWGRTGPQPLGKRAMLALTDSASAVGFGLQTAKLSRAGDNGADRLFIAPDTGGLTAGVAGMEPSVEPSVLVPNPTADAPAGYPLTTLTYAFTRPLALDADARSDYAAFVGYAVGGGQVSGLEPGDLPRGFATLPPDLRAQAAAAAETIRTLQAPPDPAPALPPPASSGGVTSTGSGPSSSPSASGSTPRSTTTTVPAAAVTQTAAAVVDEPEAEQSSGLLTPVLALARNRYLLPVLAAVALLSALAALEITKRPRRGLPSEEGSS